MYKFEKSKKKKQLRLFGTPFDSFGAKKKNPQTISRKLLLRFPEFSWT